MGDRSAVVPAIVAGDRLDGSVGVHATGACVCRQCDAILAADDAMADDLARINIPTLVVVGNQDILTPRGDSEEFAELIPTAELVVISGAAHGVMIEHASTYNRVLIDFLAGRRRRGRPASGPSASSRGPPRQRAG